MPSFKDKMLERQGKAIDIKTGTTTERYIKKIIDETGLSKKEIKDLVDEKREELKGLISEEGALFIVSKELGVSIDIKADKEEKRKQDLANKNIHSKKKDIFAGFEEKELPPEIQRFSEVVGEDNTKKFNDHLDNIIKMSDEVIEETEIIEDKEKDIQEKHDIVSYNTTSSINLSSKEEVKANWEMYQYVKKLIVDKSDFQIYKDKPSMKKSGWRKFIKPFNLSVEMIREEELNPPNPKIWKTNPRVWEEGKCPDGSPDIHAEVWIRVYQRIYCPYCKKEIRGQSIEALGYKSKSEYWSDKYKNFGSYNRHNLVATARTRGENIGISDLVGYGEVSYEEIVGDPEHPEKQEKDIFEGF